MAESVEEIHSFTGWRAWLNEVIFGTDTWLGRAFDVVLLVVVLLSVTAVCLESVQSIALEYRAPLRAFEWAVTGIFSVEYVLRLLCVQKPVRYARSFFGIVDLLSILPTYASLFFPGTHSLLVIRGFRLLRVFRVFKLVRISGEASLLVEAIRKSQAKMVAFLGAVLTIALIMGALMYLVEGAENGFTSIPRSIYWAVVTMTTVGYGDIAPNTVLGQFIAACLMIIGYGIIAVPTGIVSAEMVQIGRSTLACTACERVEHARDARFCRHCGEPLFAPDVP
jgi:voltage-gated potassium channel